MKYGSSSQSAIPGCHGGERNDRDRYPIWNVGVDIRPEKQPQELFDNGLNAVHPAQRFMK
ncbi:MAG: hypothetical protein ABGX22_19575 [Pirellulaceae bacterium]|nr:hypothetical protein [Planctomycetaceae bacterium]